MCPDQIAIPQHSKSALTTVKALSVTGRMFSDMNMGHGGGNVCSSDVCVHAPVHA